MDWVPLSRYAKSQRADAYLDGTLSRGLHIGYEGVRDLYLPHGVPDKNEGVLDAFSRCDYASEHRSYTM